VAQLPKVNCDLDHKQLPLSSLFFYFGRYSNSKSKRSLRWLGLWLLNVLSVRLRRLLPRRLDIIFDLKPELHRLMIFFERHRDLTRQTGSHFHMFCSIMG